MSMPCSDSPKDYLEGFYTKIKDSQSSPMNGNHEQLLNRAREVVENYSSEIVEQWNKEIDGWLIFVSVLLTHMLIKL